jgi:hypothetical protein
VGATRAYLPDLAETMTQLVERESTLATFETFHFAGHWDADGTQMAQAIRTAVGNPNIAVRSFPWPVITLLSPFVTLFREMQEMRHLWRQPLRLSNEHLSGVLTTEPAHIPGTGCQNHADWPRMSEKLGAFR